MLKKACPSPWNNKNTVRYHRNIEAQLPWYPYTWPRSCFHQTPDETGPVPGPEYSQYVSCQSRCDHVGGIEPSSLRQEDAEPLWGHLCHFCEVDCSGEQLGQEVAEMVDWDEAQGGQKEEGEENVDGQLTKDGVIDGRLLPVSCPHTYRSIQLCKKKWKCFNRLSFLAELTSSFTVVSY